MLGVGFTQEWPYRFGFGGPAELAAPVLAEFVDAMEATGAADGNTPSSGSSSLTWPGSTSVAFMLKTSTS